jgi:hypothetical protein
MHNMPAKSNGPSRIPLVGGIHIDDTVKQVNKITLSEVPITVNIDYFFKDDRLRHEGNEKKKEKP